LGLQGELFQADREEIQKHPAYVKIPSLLRVTKMLAVSAAEGCGLTDESEKGIVSTL